MPPPRPLFAHGLRGFVCRSCLLKLQGPRKQHKPWLTRNIATNDQIFTSKTARRLLGEQKSAVRIFNQNPDGSVTEAQDDDKEAYKENFPEDIDSKIADLQRQTGKSIEQLIKDSEHGNGILSNDASEFSQGMGYSHNQSDLKQLEEQNRKLQEQTNLLQGRFDLHSLSEKDRQQLRDALFSKPAFKDESSQINETKKQTKSPESKIHDSISRPWASETLNLPITQSHRRVNEFNDLDSMDIAAFRPSYRPYISALKDALSQRSIERSKSTRTRKRPARNSPMDSRKQIWKAYVMSRLGFLSAPSEVPLAMWTRLWKSIAPESPDNPDRMARIKCIGEDMTRSGLTMTPSQRLLFLESIFIEGDRSLALEKWEDTGKSHVVLLKHFREYWELGIRMFCQAGQPDRALSAAEILLQDDKDPINYRILLPIIRAFLVSSDATAFQHSWALYIRMRVNLGNAITMGDYDSLTSAFLDAGQQDLALGIFKDMMLTGDKAIAQQDSTELYKISTGIMSDFKPIAIGKGELDWRDSKTLARLPTRFNNAFFFGSWVKKLIGDGELGYAKQVFDMMDERGICPASVQMNGLIGAWFREGTEHSRINAEDMAWRMIKARLDFVNQRTTRYQLSAPLRTVGTKDKPSSKPIRRTPLATIETFTVLLQQYRRRSRHDLVSDLFEALRKSLIKPSTHFMNQLMWMDTRAHHKGWAWQTYKSLKDLKGASPDIDTFDILWHNMKKQVDPVIGKKPDPNTFNFTTCRGLFAEMMQYSAPINKTKVFPPELYDLIILCFSYEQDQIGTAIALRALQRHFNMLPSQTTARTIVLQLARLGLFDERGNKPRRLDLDSAATKQRIDAVTKILGKFKENQIKSLLEDGIIFENLSANAKLEQTIILLSDLLQHVASARAQQGEGNILEASRLAAEEMKTPDCVQWNQAIL